MDNSYQDLSIYRMDKVKDDLETAEILLANKKYNQSINRSYYAILHAVRSLLALDGFDSHKHSRIISYFNRNYIKTGKNDTIEFLLVNNHSYYKRLRGQIYHVLVENLKEKSHQRHSPDKC